MSNWIYRSLDIGLAVNDEGNAEVVVKDNESGLQNNLVFDNADTKGFANSSTEEIVQSIGKEVYSWLLLMFDQLDDEDE